MKKVNLIKKKLTAFGLTICTLLTSVGVNTCEAGKKSGNDSKQSAAKSVKQGNANETEAKIKDKVEKGAAEHKKGVKGFVSSFFGSKNAAEQGKAKGAETKKKEGEAGPSNVDENKDKKDAAERGEGVISLSIKGEFKKEKKEEKKKEIDDAKVAIELLLAISVLTAAYKLGAVNLLKTEGSFDTHKLLNAWLYPAAAIGTCVSVNKAANVVKGLYELLFKTVDVIKEDLGFVGTALYNVAYIPLIAPLSWCKKKIWG